MIFESPAILWALPLALLPTLIHLLGKRPRKPTPIPSLMWLNTFKTSERRRQKLRDLIVLAMRTLAILSVIFALGRPNFGVRVQELVIDNHPGLWQQGTWLEKLLEQLPAGNYDIATRDGAHFENIAQSNIAALMEQWPSTTMPLKVDSSAVLITAAYAPIPSGFKTILAPDRDSLSNAWMTGSIEGKMARVQLLGGASSTNWYLEQRGQRLMEWQGLDEVRIPLEGLLPDSLYTLRMEADSVVADNVLSFSVGTPRETWLVSGRDAGNVQDFVRVFGPDSLLPYTTNELWSNLGEPKNLVLVGFDFVPEVLKELAHNALIFPSTSSENTLISVLPQLEHPLYSEQFIAPSLRNDWPSPKKSKVLKGQWEPLLACPEGTIAGFVSGTPGAILYQQGFVPQEVEHPYYIALHQWIMRDRNLNWDIPVLIGEDYYLQNQRTVGFQTQAITGAKGIVLQDPMQIGLLLALVFALIALIFVKIF